MLRLAVAGEPLFEVSDCELRRSGPSYTVLTVQEFREQLGPEADLFWIIGADSLGELVNWYESERLVGLCQIITAARPGWDEVDTDKLRTRFSSQQVERLLTGILETPRIDVSASEVRQRIRQGRSIRYMVPDTAAAYIAEHGLYRNDR